MAKMYVRVRFEFLPSTNGVRQVGFAEQEEFESFSEALMWARIKGQKIDDVEVNKNKKF